MAAVDPPKVSDILVRVERRLAQLAGVGAQLYAEDVLVEHIQTAFTSLFEEYDWEEYKGYVETTLDGTLGVPLHDFSSGDKPLRRFGDIKAIYPDGARTNLYGPPVHVIPHTVDGSEMRYVLPYLTADGSKIFRIVPYTATGTIHVFYKSRPFIGLVPLDMPVYVDEELLVAAATLDYLTDDGTNPAATNRAAEKVALRQSEVRRNMSPILLTSGGYSGPVDYWWES